MRLSSTAAAVSAALLAVLAARGWLWTPPGSCSLLPFDGDFVLAGAAVVLDPALPPRPAALSISPAGTISAVYPLSPAAAATNLARAASLATGRLHPSPRLRLVGDGAVIAPAGVDAHVHANDPGRAGWEGLESATRAAAAGGVGTVVDMPLNSHPSAVTAAVLSAKLKKAAARRRAGRGGRLAVDVGFWGGLIPSNAGDHGELAAMASAGALGFKAFLCPSGIPDFPNASLADVRAALPFLMKAGLPLLVHAELMGEEGGGEGAAAPPPPPPTSLRAWEASRPPAWEVRAVAGLVGVLREAVAAAKAAAAAASPTSTPPPPLFAPGFRVHIAHVGTPEVIPLIAAAISELPLSGEAVPHALGGLPYPGPASPLDSLWKCAPPLRGPAAAAGLWEGLLADPPPLTTIGSDHSPAPPALKTGVPFAQAWGGISGLQFSLPATWTAAQAHAPPPSQVTPSHLASWLATHPAQLAGLGARKGHIAPGFDADLVVWAPGEAADTRAEACFQRHPATSPYVGLPLKGRVLETYVRGRLVFAGGRHAEAACGEVVVRRGGEEARAPPRAGLAGSAAAAAAAERHAAARPTPAAT